MEEISSPAPQRQFFFAPDWIELVQCVIFGALYVPFIGAFTGVLLATGLGLIGAMNSSTRILPHAENGFEVLSNAFILCMLGGIGGVFAGAQIGVFSAVILFFFAAVWVPPGKWEIIRQSYRRGMLYGALLGAACCVPLILLSQIDALISGYSRSMRSGLGEDAMGLCVVLPAGGLLAGSCVAMMVTITRVRAGKEYRTPFPLPFPFHQW